METIIFLGTAWVELQGDRALHYVCLELGYAEYQVIGFPAPIVVRDYRTGGVGAIMQVYETGIADDFAVKFNTPALIKLSVPESPILLINLYDTVDPDPKYRLWIAVGMEPYIPSYDYLLRRCEELPDEKLAFCSLYRRRHRLPLVTNAAR